MHLYGLKSCDTCRNALKSLPNAVFVDIRAAGAPRDILDRAVAAFGAALVNRRSTTWRGLSESERAMAPEDLIAAYPAVMKRPLIVDGAAIWLGWTDETRAALGVG